VLAFGAKSDDSCSTRRTSDVEFLVCQINDQKAGVIRREEQGRSDWAVGPNALLWMSVERSHSEPCHYLRSQSEVKGGCAVDVRRANPLGGDPNDLASSFSVSGD
jgi:hypothetical protein